MNTKPARYVNVCDRVRFAEHGKLYTVLDRVGPYVDKRNTGKIFIRLHLWGQGSTAPITKSVRVDSLVYLVD